jgi:hypothetical protein
VTEPPLDKMISVHPIIIQIKPLLNEAKESPRSRRLMCFALQTSAAQ